MDISSEAPLDLPIRTIAAIDDARNAAFRTRQSVEVALAPLFAGAALFAVGLSGCLLDAHAEVPDWARYSFWGSALVLALAGNIVLWRYIWASLRHGRRGGVHSPFGDALASLNTRRRFQFLAIGLLIAILQQIGLHTMRGRVPDAIYYGILIWGTRLTVLGGIGIFVYRFVRSGFWEHLVFATCIAATAGLYIFVPSYKQNAIAPAPFVTSVLSMLATAVAAALLMKRWRRWTHVNKAAESSDDPVSMEVS